MTRYIRPLACVAALAALLVLPGAARGQELYTYSVGLLGGLGGSPDPDQGDGFANTGLQLNLDLVTEPYTHLTLRLGELKLDGDDSFGSLTDASLAYATLGGEYRFAEGYYDSGIYIALGGYRLEGTDAGGDSRDDTSLGAALGFTGDFRVSRHLAVVIELSGHYTDLDEANVFGMAHAGLAFHF